MKTKRIQLCNMIKFSWFTPNNTQMLNEGAVSSRARICIQVQ
jgi:hypothetical protein